MVDYTLTELMAVTAAREIQDGEVVFAGTGLPMLGAMLAQRTHAPGCCIVFEAGTVASQLAHLPMSVGDPRVMRGAAVAAGLSEVFTYVLQAGRVDVGFLSGAQIDRFGNINSTAIGSDLFTLLCASPAAAVRATSPAWPVAPSSSPSTKSVAFPKESITSPAPVGSPAATAGVRPVWCAAAPPWS